MTNDDKKLLGFNVHGNEVRSLLTADYGEIERRLVARMNLNKSEAPDVHTLKAVELFGTMSPTGRMREAAKKWNHLETYSAGRSYAHRCLTTVHVRPESVSAERYGHHRSVVADNLIAWGFEDETSRDLFVSDHAEHVRKRS